MENKRKSKLLAALNAVRRDFEAAIMREIEAHPESPYWMVAEHAGVSEATVLKIAQANNISRPAGPHPQTENQKEDGANLAITYPLNEEVLQSACGEQL